MALAAEGISTSVGDRSASTFALQVGLLAAPLLPDAAIVAVPASLKEPMMHHGFTQQEDQNHQHAHKQRLPKSNEELLNRTPASFLFPTIRRIQLCHFQPPSCRSNFSRSS